MKNHTKKMFLLSPSNNRRTKFRKPCIISTIVDNKVFPLENHKDCFCCSTIIQNLKRGRINISY